MTRRPQCSRLLHALVAPHATPAAGVSPNAAAALLKFQETLIFSGWSKAEARAELRRLSASTTKGNAK